LGCDVNLQAPATPAKMLSFIKINNIQSISDSEDAYYKIKNFYHVMLDIKQQKKNNNKKYTNNNIVSEVDIQQNQYSKMIDVFVDTFLYEPCNTIDIENEMEPDHELTYIHNKPPNTLHSYIREFSPTDHASSAAVDCSVDDVDLETCVGHGNGAHCFMKAEGYCFCSLCAAVTCIECTFKKQNVSHIFVMNVIYLR
jgi:hypothetical protein